MLSYIGLFCHPILITGEFWKFTKTHVGSKVEVHPTFDTAFYKMLNAIDDICERACDKVLLYVANKFLR